MLKKNYQKSQMKKIMFAKFLLLPQSIAKMLNLLLRRLLNMEKQTLQWSPAVLLQAPQLQETQQQHTNLH